MSNSIEINNVSQEENEVRANILAELVEAQLDEVAGGGYSEFNASHLKD